MLKNIIMNLAVQQSRSTHMSLNDSLETIIHYFKVCMGLGYSVNKTIIMWIDNVSLDSILMEENSHD